MNLEFFSAVLFSVSHLLSGLGEFSSESLLIIAIPVNLLFSLLLFLIFVIILSILLFVIIALYTHCYKTEDLSLAPLKSLKDLEERNNTQLHRWFFYVHDDRQLKLYFSSGCGG
jgi:hypothetical protein